MFEVKNPEMVNRTFRMPKDLVEQLGEVAQKNLPDDNNEKTE